MNVTKMCSLLGLSQFHLDYCHLKPVLNAVTLKHVELLGEVVGKHSKAFICGSCVYNVHVCVCEKDKRLMVEGMLRSKQIKILLRIFERRCDVDASHLI